MRQFRHESETAESVRRSWGGPSLAGAWAVHAVGAVGFFVLVGVPLLWGLAWIQVRLLRVLLSGGASRS